MERAEKINIMETIFERAAVVAGDITESVMAAFYQKLPEARKSFEYHFPAGTHRLEASMVEHSLYCLMYWFQSMEEIEILLLGSVPHHIETLNVPASFYRELLDATAKIINKTIPTDHHLELKVYREACSSLTKLIDSCSQYAYVKEAV